MQTDTLVAPATENKDLALVSGSMDLIKEVPQLLRGNQAAVSKAQMATKDLIDRIGTNGNRLNEILDNEAQALIVRLKEGGKKMEERRKPFTQIVQSITKMFTGLEGEMKELEATIQPYRNDYAKWLQQEAERVRREAEQKARIETAKSEYKASITEAIGVCLANYLFAKKEAWQNSFSGLTIESFEEKAGKLKAVNAAFNRAKLPEILTYNIPTPALLDQVAINTARTQAHEDYDFSGWIVQHDNEMSEFKQSLIDRLPSKLNELQAAAKAEKERIEAENAAAKAEAERQEAMARAGAAERRRLEKDAEFARAAEGNRMAELKAQQDRIAADNLARKIEEDRQLAAEREDQLRKAKENAEMAAAAAKAQTLFDAAIEATPDAATPETRTGFEIAVKHHAGWAEIFQLFYTNEGVKLTIDDLGKKSLNQMKSWCEGHAKKTGEKISSKYLVYETSVKAVNRKA